MKQQVSDEKVPFFLTSESHLSLSAVKVAQCNSCSPHLVELVLPLIEEALMAFSLRSFQFAYLSLLSLSFSPRTE